MTAGPSGAADDDVDEAVVSAWQAALAAEHAAVYAYATVGGRLDRDTVLQRRASAAYEAHVARRDDLASRLDAAGETPVQAEVAYALPASIETAAGARTIGQRVEDRCAVAFAAVVAACEDDDRTAAVGWLVDASTRLLSWGGSATALPGFERP